MKKKLDLEELFKEASEGDHDALETLLKAVQPQLFRFSMKMCKHTEDAEDVLQDSMIALVKSFRDFRGTSSPTTWLFSIVRSFCIKKRRKSQFAPTVEESLEHLPMDEQNMIQSTRLEPDKEAEVSEIWRRVQEGIKLIEPTYREVLLLRDIEGLKTKEVAEIVGISVSAVKSRLHRARGQLREHLSTMPYKPKPHCPNIRRLFSQHLEGDLSPEICSTMETHLADCPICATECANLKKLLNICSDLSCEIPENIKLRVQESLKLAIEQLTA